MLEAVLSATVEGNPDGDFLMEAIQAIKQLQSVSQLRTFQAAMCKGPTANMDYAHLISEDFRESLPRQELKRQS